MIQSVSRAFSILELVDDLGAAGEGVAAQEVAKRTGLKYPTVHNFLQTLCELGYVERMSGASTYRVSSRLRTLGQRGDRVRQLKTLGEQEILRLCDRWHETISLSVERDFHRDSLVVSGTGPEAQIVQRRCDEEFFSYPVGRVHLSRMPVERIDTHVAERGFPGDSWDGIDAREKLDAALLKIQKNGFAVKENPQVQAAAISVPIICANDDLNAALCLVLPLVRYDSEKCREIVESLQKSADRIASAMEF